MTVRLEAIWENGVLKPLKPLHLEDKQKVRLILDTEQAATAPGAQRWHWAEAQSIEDGFAGAVSEEVVRQRHEG